MKTFSIKKSECKNRWLFIDATGKVLGRLASEIALALRGKNDPAYTPNMVCGDIVVLLNAKKIVLTGNKTKVKMYHKHSGYLGGLHSTSYAEMVKKQFDFPIKKAVQRMLGRGSQARALMLRLHVYEGAEHPHMAQAK